MITDIKILVVGQKVSMMSGPLYGRQGVVTKITERCVEVELLRSLGPAGAVNFRRFDTNGKAGDSRDINDENMDFDGIPGTFEGVLGNWKTPWRAWRKPNDVLILLLIFPLERFLVFIDHRLEHLSIKEFWLRLVLADNQ
jgi:hypothetical protein